MRKDDHGAPAMWPTFCARPAGRRRCGAADPDLALRMRDKPLLVDEWQLADGRIIGIEVKAAATATRSDARHLIWLREQIGDRLVCGIVLHAGPHSYPLAERIHAAPICSLWTR